MPFAIGQNHMSSYEQLLGFKGFGVKALENEVVQWDVVLHRTIR